MKTWDAYLTVKSSDLGVPKGMLRKGREGGLKGYGSDLARESEPQSLVHQER